MEPRWKTNHEGREVQVTVLKPDAKLINDAVSGAKLVQKNCLNNISCSEMLEITKIAQ